MFWNNRNDYTRHTFCQVLNMLTQSLSYTLININSMVPSAKSFLREFLFFFKCGGKIACTPLQAGFAMFIFIRSSIGNQFRDTTSLIVTCLFIIKLAETIWTFCCCVYPQCHVSVSTIICLYDICLYYFLILYFYFHFFFPSLLATRHILQFTIFDSISLKPARNITEVLLNITS